MDFLSLLLDDATVLLRWLHVIAAIVWVGSAFALARLDLGMRPRKSASDPQTLFVNAGAAFRLMRTAEADAAEPALNFKWEAYATWLSGFALLCLIFLASPRLYLIDPQIWNAPAWAAILVAVGLLPAVWVVYDLLCKKSGLAGDRLLIALFLFSAALAFLLTHLFAGRAAYPLIGANLATIMAANIGHAIVPVQRRRLAALRAGQPPDEAESKSAAARGLHNQYLALPVVFFMLSGHAPLFFAGPYNGLVAVLFLAAGFVLRRFFLKRARGLGSDWGLAGVAASCVAAGLALSAPQAPREKRAANSATEAMALVLHPGIGAAQSIIQHHCVLCHSAKPQLPGLAHAAAGLDFAAAGALVRHRREILRAAVFSRAMPPPGAAAPLDKDERLTLWRWAQTEK